MTDSKDPKSIPITFDPLPDWSCRRVNVLKQGGGELSIDLQADYSDETTDGLVVRLAPTGGDGTGCTASCTMKMVFTEDADAVVAFFSGVLKKVSEARDRLVERTEEAGAYAEFKAQREVAETADSSQDEDSV